MTLIELMIVVIILAILAAIVLPSYQNSLYKSRRSDAMTALAALQQAQERWRGNNTTYQDTLANLPLPGNATASPSGWYAMSIVTGSVGAGGYTARATADSSGKQAGDSTCNVFEVVQSGGTVTYKSYSSGGSQNGSPDPCWVK